MSKLPHASPNKMQPKGKNKEALDRMMHQAKNQKQKVKRKIDAKTAKLMEEYYKLNADEDLAMVKECEGMSQAKTTEGYFARIERERAELLKENERLQAQLKKYETTIADLCKIEDAYAELGKRVAGALEALNANGEYLCYIENGLIPCKANCARGLEQLFERLRVQLIGEKPTCLWRSKLMWSPSQTR